MAPTHTAPRGHLRLADLKQRQHVATRMMNTKIPAYVAERIDKIATHIGATKTEVVVALLEAGLDAAKRRTRS